MVICSLATSSPEDAPRGMDYRIAGAEALAALGRDGSWSEIRADLDLLTETEIVHKGRRLLVRSAPRPHSLPPPAADRPGPRRRLTR